MAEIPGIDCAWTKPDPVATSRAGYTFVIGYLSGDPTKNLSSAQIAAYRRAGLLVGLVWETTADRALLGAPAGAADGAAAKAQAAAAGYPTSAVIFAAVDFPITAAQLPTALAYLDAFGANVGHPDGGYGSLALIEALAAHRPGAYLWQTAAWSGGVLSQHAHLYQRASHNWPAIAGVPANAYDENVLCHPLPLYGAAPTPPPGGFLMALTDAQQAEMYNDLRLVVTQLCGATYLTDGHWGWPLPDGTKKTPVDMLRALYAAPPNLTAADIAAAIPADLAQAVIDALGKRITTTPAA